LGATSFLSRRILVEIRQSQEIGKLAEALAQAQGNFKPIKKERTAKIESSKGSYSYRYADLSDVLDAVRTPLANFGLALIQPITWHEEHPWLVTRLVHSSGEWIESLYPLGTYDRPQEMGSAITYARRYTLTALLGIAAEEDDDGGAAQRSESTDRRAAASSARPGKLPACPTCGTNTNAMGSKFGDLPFYCKTCKKAYADSAAAFQETSA
jgi:hypothetical protein